MINLVIITLFGLLFLFSLYGAIVTYRPPREESRQLSKIFIGLNAGLITLLLLANVTAGLIAVLLVLIIYQLYKLMMTAQKEVVRGKITKIQKDVSPRYQMVRWFITLNTEAGKTEKYFLRQEALSRNDLHAGDLVHVTAEKSLPKNESVGWIYDIEKI